MFGTDWSFFDWSNLIHRSIWLIVHSGPFWNAAAEMIFDFFDRPWHVLTAHWRLVGTFVLFTRLNFPRRRNYDVFLWVRLTQCKFFVYFVQESTTATTDHGSSYFRVLIYCQIRNSFRSTCAVSLVLFLFFQFVLQVVQSKSFNIGFASGCPWPIILFCQEKKAAYWDKGPLPVTLCCLHGFPKATTRNQHRPLRQQQPPSSLSWWLWRCWLSGDTETIILTCAFYTTQLFNLCWLVFSSNSVNWPPESEWPSSSLRCVKQRVQPYLWELWDAF